MLSYSLDKYATFTLNDYTLPTAVINVVSNLVSILNINVATPTTTVKSPTNAARPVRRTKAVRDMESEWKKPEPFKSTETVQYVGFDKKIADIRTCLNKLSAKNYVLQRDNIYGHIDIILNGEEGVSLSDDNTSQIANCIFDIASKNSFYSELYASLYKELIEKYTFFVNTVDSSIENYIQSVDGIRYENSDVDYNLHCLINKENDSRKSLLTFILMLVRNNVLDLTVVDRVISYLDKLILSNIDDKSRVDINNELVENYLIIITNTMPSIFSLETWSKIHARIVEYTTYSPKDHPGLSSRAKFKFMDMKELIAKNI